MTPQEERTNKRPETYSKWHRPPTLPKDCLLVDGDFFEMRFQKGTPVPVACIETIQIGGLFIKNAQVEYPLWDCKIALLKTIQSRMNIPVIILRHCSDMKLTAFSRLTLTGEETLQTILDEDQLKQFLLNL